MKRTFAILTALVLVLALTSMAYAVQTVGTASDTTGTVTITEAEPGETYQGYRIFDATVARSDNGTAADPSDDTSSSISYKWAGSGTMPSNIYFVEGDSGNITPTAQAGDTTNGLSEGAIALLRSWVEGGTITFPTAVASPVTVNAGEDTLVFNGLDYGYWYFTSSLGTVVSINSTNPNVSVTDKNTKPTIDKLVQEDSTSNYGKQNDAEYTQTVNFRVVIDAKKGAQDYVLYDLMDTGFTFAGLDSIHVYLNGSAPASEIPATETITGTDVTNWTASLGGTYPDGSTPAATATFHITFAQDFLDRMEDTSHIIVEYSATLNNTAAIKDANVNKAMMSYGANANTTAESETHTYTWGAKVYKYTGTLGSGETALSGAEFVICKHVSDGSTSHAFATFDANGKFTGWTQLYPDSAHVANAGDPYFNESEIPTLTSADYAGLGATILTTGTNGEINVTGLDEGSYRVIESKAPDGYNKLTTASELAINSNTGVAANVAQLTPENTCTNGTNGIVTVNVVNNAGDVLPSTGGIGTTLFYVIGGLLAVGAIVVLFVRKRAEQ